MFLDHPLNRLSVHSGFTGGFPHVPIVSLQEVDQKTSLECRDRRLLGMFEGAGFS